MDQIKEHWLGAIALLILAGGIIWWLSASQPTGMSDLEISATTSAATTTAGTSTGAKPHAVATTERDVVSIVSRLASGSSFNTYFHSTGVAASINPKSASAYTIFVPTNAAISRLAKGTISGLSSAERKRYVQYHVVSGRELDPSVLVSGSIQTLSGDMLNVSSKDGVTYVGSGKVVGEYHGTNGVVYLIDDALLPPQKSTI